MRNKLSKFCVKMAIFAIVAQSVIGFMLVNPISARAAESLIKSYVISNPAISPNLDGVLDSTSVDLEFTQKVKVAIDVVDSSGALVAKLYSSLGVTNPDAKPWDGRNSLANVVVDGVYTIRVILNDFTTNELLETDTSRKIIVDVTVPVIESHKDLYAEAINASGAIVSFIAPKATDNIDTEADAICSPNSGSTFIIGMTIVICKKTDAAENIALPLNFNVTVGDTTAPVIQLNGDTDMTVEKGSTFSDPGATATDLVDGDLTEFIEATSTVDTSAIGVYTVLYRVSDITGNYCEAIRTVRVTDAQKPVITITRDPNSDLSNQKYKISINFDVDSTIKLYEINSDGLKFYSGDFILEKAGVYIIHALGVDLSGNKGESSVTFVIDLSAPVIAGVVDSGSYNGDKNITVTDNDAIESVTLDGVAYLAPFTFTVGTQGKHTVIATDKAGNISTVSFTIVKITAPLITSVTLDSDNRTISLKYAVSAGTVKAQIQIAKDNAFSQVVKTVSQDSTALGSYIVRDLDPGFTYFFRITGYDGLGAAFTSQNGQMAVPAAAVAVVEDTTPVAPVATKTPVMNSFIPKAKAAEPVKEEVTPAPVDEKKGEIKGGEDKKEPAKEGRGKDIIVIIALLAIAGAAYYGYKKLPESDEISTKPVIKEKNLEKPEVKMPEKIEKKEIKETPKPPVKPESTNQNNQNHKKKGKR